MSVDSFLVEWHRIVENRDVAAIPGILAPDVSIGPPPYWERFSGAPLVAHLLGIILRTIEDFRYDRQWRHGADIALEFRGRVGGVELQGIDLLHVDGEGRLDRIDVMIRPANAVEVLREIVGPQMVEYLARSAEEGS